MARPRSNGNHIWQSFGIVAGKSARGGKISICTDGIYRGNVNLYSCTTLSRRIVYTFDGSDNQVHRV